MGRHGKKIYNFDDPSEFADTTIEPHVGGDQPMQDADHEDG